MRKILMILLILVIPAHVFAGDRMYVKGNIGLFIPGGSTLEFEEEEKNYDIGTVESNTGFGLSAAVGQSFGPLDVELEFAYRNASLDKFEAETVEIQGAPSGTKYSARSTDLDGSMNIKTLMANGIYNFKSNSSITPYIGLGMGISWIDFKDFGEFDETKFAYQLLAGIETVVTKNVSLLLGYRYLGMGDVSADMIFAVDEVSSGTPIFVGNARGEGRFSTNSHNFEVGLKYFF